MDDELGTAGDDTPVDPTPESPDPAGTTEPEVKSFINPADLPPELKPHWSRMHRAYTKALEEAKGRPYREKAEMVDRFWQDQDFARQTIQQWAQQNGVHLTFGQVQAMAQGATQSPARNGVPQELIGAIEEELPQELKWLAKPLAASTWKAQGSVLGPILQETRQKEASARVSEFETLADELTEKAPGWEAHEDDMNELLGFLQGKDMRHRRWGSKLELLHRLVSGDASAVREAVRRQGEAARNRTSTGLPGRSTTTNIEQRVREAKNNHEAFKIAAEHAVEELRRAGAQV